MLSIGTLSLGQEAYYLEEVLDGAEDYYLHAGEAPGRWLGSAAPRVGLAGEVRADDLRAVLSGDAPTGEPLRSTRASLPGLDLTLSAPKSGSEPLDGAVDGGTDRAAELLHGEQREVDAQVPRVDPVAVHERESVDCTCCCRRAAISKGPRRRPTCERQQRVEAVGVELLSSGIELQAVHIGTSLDELANPVVDRVGQEANEVMGTTRVPKAADRRSAWSIRHRAIVP